MEIGCGHMKSVETWVLSASLLGRYTRLLQQLPSAIGLGQLGERDGVIVLGDDYHDVQ